MSVHMMPVGSTRIDQMGYDEVNAVVYVRFPGGKAWQYNFVPVNIWDDFVAAASKGRFIHEVLNQYDHGPADI